MIDFIQKNWEWVGTTLAGVFGIGGLFNRTKTHGERIANLEQIKRVTVADCIKTQGSCEKLQKVYHDAHKDSYYDIKKTFLHMKECNDQQHKDIMDHLMHLKDNNHG